MNKKIVEVIAVEFNNYAHVWFRHEIRCKSLKEAKKVVENVQNKFGLEREAKIVITYKRG